MKLKIANNRRSIIAKLGIGCVVCLLLGFGILLYAQDQTKVEFIATKPEMSSFKKPEIDAAKMQAMMKMKEQAATQPNRFRGRQNRGGIDFGENAAFYKVIIDNNLFRPLGWTPPKNEPAYSLIGTAVGADGALSQATLLEKEIESVSLCDNRDETRRYNSKGHSSETGNLGKRWKTNHTESRGAAVPNNSPRR